MAHPIGDSLLGSHGGQKSGRPYEDGFSGDNDLVPIALKGQEWIPVLGGHRGEGCDQSGHRG